jgi:MHS family proline/betaine transporter-like MFS transporter
MRGGRGGTGGCREERHSDAASEKHGLTCLTVFSVLKALGDNTSNSLGASRMASVKRVIASTMIGNGLEWYDYALYGTFTALISKHFFPAGDETAALLATFGIFAVGFFMRPIGGMLFGYIGDKYGRKNALALSILMMAIPTSCIGLLPTYASIGVWAPILLTVIRLVQGLAVGGEFGGSVVYLVEHANKHNKNMMGSTSILSLVLGLLAGAAVSSLLAAVMTPEDFESFGWRIPFILGFFIGIVGLYIRNKLCESPAFTEAKEAGHLSERPVRDAFLCNYKEILLGLGVYLAVTIPFYIQTVFMNSFMIKFLDFSAKDALSAYVAVLIAMMALTPVSAFLCDKYGRTKVMALSLAAYLLYALPFAYFLQLGAAQAVWAQIGFAAIMAFYIAPVPALLVDLFPARTRYTGMSLSANLAAALFGGTAPMVLAKLLDPAGTDYYPISWYVILAATASFACLACAERAVRTWNASAPAAATS